MKAHLIEKLAELEHEQWTHWTRYFIANVTPENLARWKTQCATSYSELTEAEKEKDRAWARRVMAILEKEVGKS